MTNLSNEKIVVSIESPDPELGWSPCMDWCWRTFGQGETANWRYRGEGVFEFDNEHHAQHFLLRWG